MSGDIIYSYNIRDGLYVCTSSPLARDSPGSSMYVLYYVGFHIFGFIISHNMVFMSVEENLRSIFLS